MSTILGNKGTVSRLDAQAREGRLQGAYLLCGPKSTGKATLAKRLSRTAVCLGTRDTSCTCRQCLQGEACLDLLSVSPNASGNILSSMLEPARALLQETSSTGSPCRALVVDGLDKLHSSASDDLLKLLESLLPGNLVLCTSSNPSRIPDTLRSRFQEVHLSSLGREDTVAAMKALGHRGKWVEELSRNSSCLSLGLLSEPQVYEGAYKLSERLHKAIGKLDLVKALTLSESAPSGPPALATLELLLLRVTDHMLVRMGAHTGATFGADEEEPEAWSEEFSLPVYDVVSGAIGQMHRGSPGKGILSWAVTACVARLAQAKQSALLNAPVKKC